MKGIFGSTLLASTVILMVACNEAPQPESTGLLRTEQATPAQRERLLGDMRKSFSEIKQVLDLIDQREHFMTGQVHRTESDEIMHRRLVYNMSLLNGLMHESRDRLTKLAVDLDEAKVGEGEQRDLLKECETRLQQHEVSLEDLRTVMLQHAFEAEELQRSLSTMELAIAKQEALIEQQDVLVNRAWYAVGNTTDLEKRGVIARTGGWAGVGKRRVLNGSAKQGLFVEVDKRDLHRLELNCKKANLLTEHPNGSYRFVVEEDQLAYLDIRDPEAFWRFSRYAVVEKK